MTFIKSLFLLLVVVMAAPASASVFLPVDTVVSSGVYCSVAVDKKEDGKQEEEEEEPDCE